MRNRNISLRQPLRAAYRRPTSPYTGEAWVRCKPGAINDSLACQLSLDKSPKRSIINTDRKQISLRGAGCIRLRLDSVVLTREPDTASTVGGKDADMGVSFGPHCTWTDCNVVNFFRGTPENTPFAIWTALFSRPCSMKIPKYTKYSEISILCSERKCLAQIIKNEFSADAGEENPLCKPKPNG